MSWALPAVARPACVIFVNLGTCPSGVAGHQFGWSLVSRLGPYVGKVRVKVWSQEECYFWREHRAQVAWLCAAVLALQCALGAAFLARHGAVLANV